MVYSNVDDGQLMAFVVSKNVPGIRQDYDTGINRALGLPRGMYHFSFRVPLLADLESQSHLLLRSERHTT
jgi:hypothetical protein